MLELNSIFLYSDFWGQILRSAKRDRVLKKRDIQRVILRQLQFTGQQAFRIVAMTGIFVGILTVAQSTAQLQRWGGTHAIGPLLVAALFRELGPFLTALIVISRSVSAVASELSAMKANGEIEMLKSSGISPISYLVIPRVVSGALALLMLTTHFVWISLGIGYLSAQMFVSIPWTKYISDILMALSLWDLLFFVFKISLTGLGIFSLACFQGLKTNGKSYEIPVATTQAVVSSTFFTFILQISLSLLYYFFFTNTFEMAGIL